MPQPSKKGSEAAKKAWKTIRSKKKMLGKQEYQKQCDEKKQIKKEKAEQAERERLEALRILEEMGKQHKRQ